MGKILTSLLLAGTMALGIGGCIEGTDISETAYGTKTEKKVSKITYKVDPQHSRLIIERDEKESDIEWTRYPTCCQKLEQGYSSLVLCLTDEGRGVIGRNLGENLWIFNRNDKDNVSFDDFDCDGNVDRIYNSKLEQSKSRFEPETDELFKTANQYFSGYKNKLREGVNLEQETQKWLESRKERKGPGLLDNL